MDDKKSGSLVVSSALALCAGVLGSLFTLLVTSNLNVPVINTQGLVSIDATASTGTELTAGFRDSAFGSSDQQSSDTRAAHDELRAAMQDASDERAQLALTLTRLTRQIEDLESDAINLRSIADLSESAESEQSSDDFSDFGNIPVPPGTSERVSNLVAAGVDYDSAQALQNRQDSYQLARLELFDLAEREGWIESDQFSTELEDLDDQRLDLREELGDEQYDRYLFEAGRNNRVVVQSIIPGSAAELAGLQQQDMVITYASGRVFSTNDLQQATRQGVRGELVPMQVERQGQSLFFDVSRGPLGVTLSSAKQSPS